MCDDSKMIGYRKQIFLIDFAVFFGLEIVCRYVGNRNGIKFDEDNYQNDRLSVKSPSE